jgi:hypothetical protein
LSWPPQPHSGSLTKLIFVPVLGVVKRLPRNFPRIRSAGRHVDLALAAWNAVSFRTMKLRNTSHDSKSQRLAPRVANLEEKLFGVMERNSHLEEENASLHKEVASLQQQLAAARKDSSTSSKPPSSDMVKPPKPTGRVRQFSRYAAASFRIALSNA